jgi:uncharacterized spore protein YtfJ
VKLDELVTEARDAITVRRVFGEPYAQDGVTVVPAARLAGGAGGGGGHDQQGQEGEGGGFGMRARPAGVYVIKAGRVSWIPAVDVNRVLAVFGAVTIAVVVSRARVLTARAKAKAAHQS